MKKISLSILVILICTNLWSQKSFLEYYIEGYEDEEVFARNHKIKSIKITRFKAKRTKLKQMKIFEETEYNTHGKVIYFKEYLRKRGKYSETQNRIYDKNNRLIKMKIQKKYSRDYTTNYSMKYNSDSSLILIDVDKGQRKDTFNYLLSKDNKIIAEIRKQGDTIFYNYNKFGKLINKSRIKNDTVNQIIYDEDGNLLENNYFESNKYKYHLDSIGNCIKSEYFIQPYVAFKLDSWRSLEYDKDGKILKVIIYNGENEIEEYYKYIYDGVLKKTKEYFNTNGKLYQVDKYEYTFYN